MPKKQDAASAAGCPIGSHIEIEWQKNTWYAGVVTDFNLDSGEHYVVYADGEDEQDEDLRVMKYRFIEDVGGQVGVEDGAEANEKPAHPENPWRCAHCDFSSPYLSVATAHEQSCLAHQAQEAISRERLLWSPDIDEEHVVDQLGWACGSQTFGSDKLAMKHFQAFNKFRLLRELYRPTRCMCKHEVAQHAARAASYGNWYHVRCAESTFAPIPLIYCSLRAPQLTACVCSCSLVSQLTLASSSHLAGCCLMLGLWQIP